VSRLYDRRVVLVVGKVGADPKAEFIEALRISDLRVTFKVEKTDKPEPNKADIAVYNLSAQSRAALEGKGTPVLLLAGYADGDNVSQAFAGEARIIDSTKAGVDWVTRIQCGDGERAYCTAQVNESAQPGAAVKDMVMKLAKSLVKDPGNALQKANEITRQWAAGYAAHGNAAAELSRLLEAEGFQWSVQDGRLEILRATEFTADMGPLFTPSSGLIGTPTLGTPEKVTQPGQVAAQTWKVKVLLEPRVRPGQRFEVERTVSTDGRPVKREQFRARKVHHLGDTHGADWATEIEATQL
jgi:hypothetical protein